MTPKFIALPGVNLRTGPGLTRTIIRQMSAGTPAKLFDGLTVTNNLTSDKYTWQAILLADNTVGWCVTTYDGSAVFVNPSAPPRGSIYGVHLLAGGNSNEYKGIAQRLKDAGKPMGAVLVAGEPDLATGMLGNVKTIIYRTMKVQPWSPDYDPDPAKAYIQGRQWVRDRQGEIVGLDRSIVIQYANEGAWKPTEVDFWRGVLDENAGARRLALYADAVGNPSDDGGISAITRWNTRLPTLRRAKVENHLYAFHVYSSKSTAPGMLTEVGDRHNYETRIRRLYDITPSDARIPAVATEVSREHDNGTYDGEAPTIAWLKALAQEYANDDYIIGICQFTGGVWKSSSVDAARAALETLFRGSL